MKFTFVIQVAFLEQCLQEYERKITALSDQERASILCQYVGKDILRIRFKDQFHLKLPPEFSYTKPITSGGETELVIAHDLCEENTYFEFHKQFRCHLNEKYGHLAEELLFGKVDDSNAPVLLFEDFKGIRVCVRIEDYMKLLEHQFHLHAGTADLVTAFRKLFNEVQPDEASTHAELHQLINDELTTFCFYLIESRLHSMQIFEQFEHSLHKLFCSFEFISGNLSSTIKRNVRVIVEKYGQDPEDEDALLKIAKILNVQHTACSIHCNHEAVSSRKEVYRKEVQLYHDFLSVLSTSGEELIRAMEVKQCLSNDKNHFSYLHEHLTRLAMLLSQVSSPYSFSIEEKDGSFIFTISMTAGSINHTLAFLNEQLMTRGQTLKTGDEVRLCADTILYGDTDMKHSELNFQGVNVVIITPQLISIKQGKLQIATDGKSLSHRDIPESADSGEHGTESRKNGENGKDGENGRFGNPGGHILLVACNMIPDQFLLSATGSQGEDGQNGGNGGNGWSPTTEGRNGTYPDFSHSWGYRYCKDTVIINYGTYGQNGGKGGDAGMGGASGKSGISGKIQLLDLDSEENFPPTQEEAYDGIQGNPGKPGECGRHTRHGWDYGGYAAHAGFWGTLGNFFGTSDKRTKSYVHGELSHSAILHDPGSGSNYERRGVSNPTVHNSPSHPDYVDRGQERDGKKATCKVNSAIAKENSMINKQACLAKIQAQCLKSLEHWNSKSHNHFLNAFAHTIGESCDSKLVSFTHSEIIKANRAMWFARIERLTQVVAEVVTHQARETRRAQVQVMKDYEEEYKNSALGFIGIMSGDRNEPFLDLTPLIERADQQSISLQHFSLESLLLNDLSQEVRNLPGLIRLSEEEIFVIVSDSNTSPNINCEFYIVKQNTQNWTFYHPLGAKIIDDEEIVEVLEELDIENTQAMAVERDDDLYPKICHWLSSMYGVTSVLPFSSKQHHCIKQLELIILIKNSYHLIGQKCFKKPQKLQIIQRMYSMFLDELLHSRCSSTLLHIQNLLLDQNFLIPSVGISWFKGHIFKDPTVIESLQILVCSVESYNKCQTLKQLLNIMVKFHSYHLECITSPQTRGTYLELLSELETQFAFQKFEDELTHALKVFCGKIGRLQAVPSITFSETILQKIPIQHPPEEQIFQEQMYLALAMFPLKIKSSGVRTIVDTMIENLVLAIENVLGGHLALEPEAPPLLKDLSFIHAYNAYLSLPSCKTALVALHIYMTSSYKDRTGNEDKYFSLLEYLYGVVYSLLLSFQEDSSLTNLVASLEKMEFNIKDAHDLIKTTSDSASLAMSYLLDLIMQLLSLGDDSHEDEGDGYHNLILSFPKVLNRIMKFCDRLFHIPSTDEDYYKKVKLRNHFIADQIPLISKMREVLHHNLMSYPLPVICQWLEIAVELKGQVDIKIKLFKNCQDTTDSIFTNLHSLAVELQTCISTFTLVKDLLPKLAIVKAAPDLNLYTSLYNSPDGAVKKQLTAHVLCLDDGSGVYIEALSSWLGPALLDHSRCSFHLQIERLLPKYKLCILSEAPDDEFQIDKLTVILSPKGDGWQSCSLDSSDRSNCRQYRSHSGDDITSLLGADIHDKIEKLGPLSPHNDTQARILGKLNFESEFNITLNIQFCGQSVPVPYKEHFLHLIGINTNTCQIRIFDKYEEAQSKSCVVIIAFQCTPESLEIVRNWLGLHKESQDYERLKKAAGAFIIKHHGQPLVIQTVTDCGDIESVYYQYSSPLVTDISYDNDVLLSEQLQPLSILLNTYLNQYQTNLPNEILESSLHAALTKCPKLIFSSDIPSVVRSVRRGFVSECISALAHPHYHTPAVREAMNQMLTPNCANQALEDIHLIGLESYASILVRKGGPSLKQRITGLFQKTYQIQNTEEPNNDIAISHWHHILSGTEHISSYEAECLCNAFAYYRDPAEIEYALSGESTFIRVDMFTTIQNGLHCLDVQLPSHKNYRNSTISSLLRRASLFIKGHQLEALVEVGSKLEDERNLSEMLSLIQSNSILCEKVMKIKCVADCSSTIERCKAVLISSTFFAEASQITLTWYMDEILQIVTQFQRTLSNIRFSQDGNREIIIDTILSWLMDRMKFFLGTYKWESVDAVILVGKMLSQKLYYDLQQCSNSTSLTSPSEGPDILSSFLTVVQVIEVFSDVSSVCALLQQFSSDLWLKHLLADLFMTTCTDHFNIEYDDDLHDMLIILEPKLIQILYNVFVHDQYNRDEQTDSSFGAMSFHQLVTIIEWLPFVEPCNDVYHTLCRTSMSLWEKEISEIHFKQYLDHWKDMSEANKQRAMYMMNRVRLDNGISHMNFMTILYSMRSKYMNSSRHNSTILIKLFEDLYYKRILLVQAETIAADFEYDSWREQIEAIKTQNGEQRKPRNAQVVLRIVRKQVLSGEYSITEQEMELIEDEVIEITEYFEEKLQEPLVNRKVIGDFFSALQMYPSIFQKELWLKNNFVQFVIHLIKAWMLTSFENGWKQLPYNTQIVSLVLFLHTNEQGLLQQIRTGEGKTIIVGMFAAAKALLGYHVDVISSNRDLAEEGKGKCQAFFKAVGLQAAVNCTDDDDVNQQAYRSPIVYGEAGSFQRDHLTEESEPGGTNFHVRYSDLHKNCLIVDEVDSMFLDKGRHVLYLSHESPALKHLESLFLNIWSAVLGISFGEDDTIVDEVLNGTAEQLITLIDTKTIVVLEYLTDFCKRKMRGWVRSAYQARFMDANDQFVIDQKTEEENEMRQIFPMDKQTGIEQYNMKWSNGLSQFLELKYRRPLSTESLKAVFISNKRFFLKYGKRLYGLTGTLGSDTSRQLLQTVYNIKTVELPRNQPKRYTEYKSRIGTSDKEWCDLIYQEVQCVSKEQPILVICENVKQMNILKDHIKALKTKIIDYARDGDEVEHKFHTQGGAVPGEIIIATNKGGRGTDIKINDRMAPKGLHVIITFLPENTRIEEQAFGRAARAGQAGSGCLIIQVDLSEYEDTLRVFGLTTAYSQPEAMEAATEAVIEMEKIKRDKAEKDRVNLLLNEGIPKLDLEENLYKLFQRHRLLFSMKMKDAMLFDVEISGSIKKVCISILIDQWAYWLDSMHGKIEEADSSEKQNDLVCLFNQRFPTEALSAPSSSADSMLLTMPEYSTELGQAYLKEISKRKETASKEQIKLMYQAALTCFERANESGDQTGFPAMAACYCYINISNDATPTNKKKVRRYLKAARTHLNGLKQFWMANCEVGKSLCDLVDVKEHVNRDDNPYVYQVEQKLQVVGLHLNTVEKLLGSSVEESSFVNESSLTAEMITEEQSKEIYQELSIKGIISHQKVRNCWKRRELLEPLIRHEVEPLIADGLIKLVIQSATISEADLTHLVFCSDDLWDIISSLMGPIECVMVIETEQVDQKLPEELTESWRSLKCQVADFANKTSSSLFLPKYDDGRYIEFTKLFTHLRDNVLCVDTRRGRINAQSCSLLQTLDLQRYEHCKIINQQGDGEQGLRDFLVEMFMYCIQEEDSFFYEHMLPYDKRSKETKKLHVFLQHKEILKSGELAVHKYESAESDQLEASVRKALGERYSKEKMTLIMNTLRSLQGEVRAFERRLEVGFVNVHKLTENPEDIPAPEAVDFFITWHMDNFLKLEQAEKGWWDWNAFAVAMLGLAQVIAGAALIALTAGVGAQIGNALIAEGINDMVYATMAGITGTFSWKDYAIQKAISVAISIATGGIGALAAPAKVTAKVGSASRFATFIKTVAKAAGEFALNVTTSIISDVVLAEAQKRMVERIVELVITNLLSKLRERLRFKLERLYATSSDDEFHNRCQTIVKELRTSLGLDNIIPAELDQVRSQVASCLRNNYKQIAENLGRSNSKWAKATGSALKASLLANRVFSAVRKGIKLGCTVDAMVNLVDIGELSDAIHSDSNGSIVDRELEEIEGCFRSSIEQQVQEKLSKGLNKAIKGSLKQIAKAGKKAASSTVKKAFKDKRSSEVVKELYKKKQIVTVVRDHDENPFTADRPAKPKSATETTLDSVQKKRESFDGTIVQPKKRAKELEGVPVQRGADSHDSKRKRPKTNPQAYSDGLQQGKKPEGQHWQGAAQVPQAMQKQQKKVKPNKRLRIDSIDGRVTLSGKSEWKPHMNVFLKEDAKGREIHGIKTWKQGNTLQDLGLHRSHRVSEKAIQLMLSEAINLKHTKNLGKLRKVLLPKVDEVRDPYRRSALEKGSGRKAFLKVYGGKGKKLKSVRDSYHDQIHHMERCIQDIKDKRKLVTATSKKWQNH